MQIGIFKHKIGKICHFLSLGMGLIFGPSLRVVTVLSHPAVLHCRKLSHTSCYGRIIDVRENDIPYGIRKSHSRMNNLVNDQQTLSQIKIFTPSGDIFLSQWILMMDSVNPTLLSHTAQRYLTLWNTRTVALPHTACYGRKQLDIPL